MRIATLLVCLLAATACDESPTGPTVTLDQQFTLAPGETASIDGRGARLRFEGVTGDSRCPVDAICIQGGDAVVKVQASGEEKGKTRLDIQGPLILAYRTASMEPVGEKPQ